MSRALCGTVIPSFNPLPPCVQCCPKRSQTCSILGRPVEQHYAGKFYTYSEIFVNNFNSPGWDTPAGHAIPKEPLFVEKNWIPFRGDMEILPEGKHFRLAEREELPEILDILEKYLPESLKFHQTLKTYLNDFIWDFHFYVAKSWPEDPICLHFPGMTSSPNGLTYESFSVFCPTSRIELLQLLEEEDILLDWTKPLFLNFIHSEIVKRLEDHYQKIGSPTDRVKGDVYICLEPESDLPPQNLIDEEEGVELRKLEKKDVETIHKLYPANDMEAIGVFETLISRLPAFGVFCDGELAAWMVQSYYGAMFSMQTRPEFRRRGYGIHLARKLTKVVRERGYIPYVMIRPENDASKALYTKLGFKKHYESVRVVLRPHNTLENEEPPKA